MTSYINNRSFLKYLPRKQIRNNNQIVLLHIQDIDGKDYYCFEYNKKTDMIFVYCDTGNINSEYGDCPVEQFINTTSWILVNSKSVGKTMKEVERK